VKAWRSGHGVRSHALSTWRGKWPVALCGVYLEAPFDGDREFDPDGDDTCQRCTMRWQRIQRDMASDAIGGAAALGLYHPRARR
jgi:hypothetical protein